MLMKCKDNRVGVVRCATLEEIEEEKSMIEEDAVRNQAL